MNGPTQAYDDCVDCLPLAVRIHECVSHSTTDVFGIQFDPNRGRRRTRKRRKRRAGVEGGDQRIDREYRCQVRQSGL